MNQEVNIIERVLQAQQDIDAADALIRDYYPFIKSETAKNIGRIPVEGNDDELSIALMGFHEAIESYNHDKGAFFSFASLVIKRRIIDFLRQENQFVQQVSLDETYIADEKGGVEQISESDPVADKEALKWEIIGLSKELARLGITISEVAANCPKQEKTVESCREAVSYIMSDQKNIRELFETGKIPVNQIIKGTSVKKKTLERHRKYLVALAIIYFREYECMIAHLSEVFKTKKGGK